MCVGSESLWSSFGEVNNADCTRLRRIQLVIFILLVLSQPTGAASKDPGTSQKCHITLFRLKDDLKQNRLLFQDIAPCPPRSLNFAIVLEETWPKAVAHGGRQNFDSASDSTSLSLATATNDTSDVTQPRDTSSEATTRRGLRQYASEDPSDVSSGKAPSRCHLGEPTRLR